MSLLLILISGGCDYQLDFRELVDQIVEQVVPPPSVTETPSDSSPTIEATEVVETTPTPDLMLGTVELVVWVPPIFDPQLETNASQLFKQRIAEFEEIHDDVYVTVRVKSPSGATGLLEALSITSSAATQAMPSLVALQRSDLETAVSRNLLIPFEAYSNEIDEQDWYAYAQRLTVVGGNSYGLPFAGDALAMIYRPDSIENPPNNWNEILSAGNPIAFPAADPQSLLTMTLYLEYGGEFDVTQRLPQMDIELLTQIYQLYDDGEEAGIFPLWVTQLQRDTDAWTAYNELRSNQVITWASRYLRDPAEDSTLVLLPSHNNTSVTLADGWVWCLTDAREQAHPLSVELAEFLIAPEYLNAWAPTAGVLPVRPSTVNAWDNPSMRNLLIQLAQSSHVRPNNEIIGIIGLVMEDQLIQVLSGNTTAPFAAQAIIDRIGNP
ncbi:MAG TPA: extracellular solute-binding protein [Anaerolineaceae bacterium]|nr:extracellular solute-binding protein [Anaerolineaceae bacterium]